METNIEAINRAEDKAWEKGGVEKAMYWKWMRLVEISTGDTL